jgi:hypothetical protein
MRFGGSINFGGIVFFWGIIHCSGGIRGTLARFLFIVGVDERAN